MVVCFHTAEGTFPEMKRLLIISKCRANGRHVAAGEILDESNTDAGTLKALRDDGRGRWISEEEKPVPAPQKPDPIPEPETHTKTVEAEVPKPRRGRPKREA